MDGSNGSNTMGGYTVLRRLPGRQAPGRVYTAHNAATGRPAILVAVQPEQSHPTPGWRLRLETGTYPRPFLAVEVLAAPACAHPAQELADIADLAASALESVEEAPKLQAHLESRRSPWRRLWRTHARARTPYLSALAGAVVAGMVALLAAASVRTPKPAQPTATSPVGLAEPALQAPEALPVAHLDNRAPALALDMPPRPFRNQYRVDAHGKCQGTAETPINGGCWVLLGSLKPPCGREAYEHKGGCYWPSMPSAKDPSSTAPHTPLGPAQKAP